MSDSYKFNLQGERAAATASGKLRLFLLAQAVWLVITIPLVTSFGILKTESLFVLAFVGWLCACVLFEPASSTPRWWRLAVWITRGGFLLLGYFVLLRAQNIGLL